MNNCPVQLLQEETEFSRLLEIYIDLKPKNVIEIGSFYGGTLWHWLEYNSQIKKILCIDMPIPPSDGRYQDMVKSRALWRNWTDAHPNLAFDIINTNSTWVQTVSAARSWFPDKDVDFLYIDGGHDYETVRQDYNNYGDLVKPGGIIALHDITGLEGVMRMWQEIKASGVKVREITSNPIVGWGIGIVYK